MKKIRKLKTEVHVRLDDELIAYLDSKRGKTRSAAIRDIVWASLLLDEEYEQSDSDNTARIKNKKQ